MELCSEEAVKYVWEGAIPLQIHLHESEVTTLPPPPPVLVLGSRIGYLPLLIPLIKPHFSSTLPPGTDTIWFDYKGLPLKWYIPTGVLFDLLCAEPERPWNLTVHFRGHPGEILTPFIKSCVAVDMCYHLSVHFRGHPGEILTPFEGEDSVKWSYINSLKEAAYIINGNCKNVMNMSQADQFELWQSLIKGNMDSYLRISSRLKLGPVGENRIVRTASSLAQPRQAIGDSEFPGSSRPSRIPVRLYVRHVGEDLDDLEDAPLIDSWDTISYLNRPVEIHKEEGDYLTLGRAMEALLPELFDDGPLIDDLDIKEESCQEADLGLRETDSMSMARSAQLEEKSCTTPDVQPSRKTKIKLIRIQGIELDLDIPFLWVVNNLKNPEYFLHICVFVMTSLNQGSAR